MNKNVKNMQNVKKMNVKTYDNRQIRKKTDESIQKRIKMDKNVKTM